MKKLLLLMVVCLVSFLLFACNDEKIDNGPTKVDNKQTVEVKNVTEVKEIKDKKTDFSKEAGFVIEKSADISNIDYETVFLKGSDTAQLDLVFKNGGKATLAVSKTEKLVTDEGAVTRLISDIDVTSVQDEGDFVYYYWQKEGFFYSLVSNSKLDDNNLTKIINGFSTIAKEGTI